MNEGFNEASFAPIAADVPRTVDDVIEAGGVVKSGYARGKWNHNDGTEYRGYKYPSGQLVGSPFVLSAARNTALATEQSAHAAERTQNANFRQSIRDGAQAVKDSGGLTAAQQLTLLRQLTVKLARAIDGVLADLP